MPGLPGMVVNEWLHNELTPQSVFFFWPPAPHGDAVRLSRDAVRLSAYGLVQLLARASQAP